VAATDPKFIIRSIVETYINGIPVTKDDNITPAYDLHLYERGPEDIKYLFFTVNADVVFFYGEPRVRSAREIQDVPVHYLMRYPVTVVTIDKHTPGFGPLVCTASIMQAKARTAIRAAIAGSAQSATPAYTLTIMEEQGRNERRAGFNVWSTPYFAEYMTG